MTPPGVDFERGLAFSSVADRSSIVPTSSRARSECTGFRPEFPFVREFFAAKPI